MSHGQYNVVLGQRPCLGSDHPLCPTQKHSLPGLSFVLLTCQPSVGCCQSLPAIWATIGLRTQGFPPRCVSIVSGQNASVQGSISPSRVLHQARASFTPHRANSLPVNSVFFHSSELGLYFDLGASSCRCLKSSCALFPLTHCNVIHVYLLLWTLDSVRMPIGWAARHHS